MNMLDMITKFENCSEYIDDCLGMEYPFKLKIISHLNQIKFR